MTEQYTNSGITLELRERSMDRSNMVTRHVELGTEQPVVLIEFVGEVGKSLDRIIIETTGWEPAALGTLFEDLAKALKDKPDEVISHKE